MLKEIQLQKKGNSHVLLEQGSWLAVFCLYSENITQEILNTKNQETKGCNKRRDPSQVELTLKISNQNVIFTGYKTRMPERMALWRTTPLNFGDREAKCNVGPLPTDWPYKITSSCLSPYSLFKQLYTASMS